MKNRKPSHTALWFALCGPALLVFVAFFFAGSRPDNAPPTRSPAQANPKHVRHPANTPARQSRQASDTRLI